MLGVGRINWPICALRHEDFDGFMRVSHRTLIQALGDVGVSFCLTALDGLRKFRMLMLRIPPVWAALPVLAGITDASMFD